MDISIKYVSAGLARCDRNRMSKSGAVATIDPRKRYFSTYSAGAGIESSSNQAFLEVPESLSKAGSELLEMLRKAIELKHGRPIAFDFSKCGRGIGT